MHKSIYIKTISSSKKDKGKTHLINCESLIKRYLNKMGVISMAIINYFGCKNTKRYYMGVTKSNSLNFYTLNRVAYSHQHWKNGRR